jgi:hypothetical protein
VIGGRPAAAEATKSLRIDGDAEDVCDPYRRGYPHGRGRIICLHSRSSLTEQRMVQGHTNIRKSALPKETPSKRLLSTSTRVAGLSLSGL